MKKIVLMAALCGAATMAQAQNTYFNDQLTTFGNDVNGTSRFVGMGGAMGALGADISTIGYNPAGIGLFRKNDLSMTAGALWTKNNVSGYNRARGTFDQMGGVVSLNLNESGLKYLNFGFNYQKRNNLLGSFMASGNLNGLSQMDEMAEIINSTHDTNNNLAGWSYDNYYTEDLYRFDAGTAPASGKAAATPVYVTGADGKIAQDKDGYKLKQQYNRYRGNSYNYKQHTTGGIHAFDFNIAGNVNDRFYFGLTFGFDNVKYRLLSRYNEKGTSTPKADMKGVAKSDSTAYVPGNIETTDYYLDNDQALEGYGFNIKMGTIIRPFEESPFRVALACETPTWYKFKSSTFYKLDPWMTSGTPESYLEYSMRTPWKLRVGVGSTFGTMVAADVDYEYCKYSATKMGYTNNNNDYNHGSLFSNTWDDAMNNLTQYALRAMHTVKVGVEVKMTPQWAARIGYNYSTSNYKDKNLGFDQNNLNSYAMDYATSTCYMRMGDTNILTLGLGYKGKHVYVDLAYKLRNQHANFYAFDANAAWRGAQVYDVVNDLSNLGTGISSSDVDLTRHQLTATLGVKF